MLSGLKASQVAAASMLAESTYDSRYGRDEVEYRTPPQDPQLQDHEPTIATGGPSREE